MKYEAVYSLKYEDENDDVVSTTIPVTVEADSIEDAKEKAQKAFLERRKLFSYPKGYELLSLNPKVKGSEAVKPKL